MIQLLKGRNRKLILPNGEEHIATYVIVNLNDIKASHNEVTFSDTEGYPKNELGININDRNYKGDISAQNNVYKIAENLNPENLISLSSTPSGTPIIDKNGIVVSGNNRVMSLKLAAKKYPDNYEKYKKQLTEDLGVFGFTIDNLDNIKFDKPFTDYIEEAKNLIYSNKLYIEYQKLTSGVSKGGYIAVINNPENPEVELPNIKWEERHATGKDKDLAKKALSRMLAEYLKRMDKSVSSIKYPALVRIDESLPDKLTTEDLAKFNQDSKKGERPVDRAIKLSNILLQNTRCRDIILAIIDGYDTFSDLYSPEGRNDRKKLVENFVQCGLIPEAQLPTYYDGGDFTEIGKDYVESLLSAIILTPDALKVSSAEGVKRLRQIVIGSLPLLITNEALKDGSLKKYISDAVIIQYKINQLGDFSDYIRTQTIFAEEKPEEKSLYINALLRQGRNNFKNAIRKYNDSVKSNEGESLFASEQLSNEKIFELVIENAIDEKDRKLIQSVYPKNIKKEAMQQQPTIDTKEAIEDIINEEVIITQSDNILVDDNWYKLHPEKILGEAYQTSGRFGKVTKYSGTIEALSRIEAPTDFIGNNKGLIDPLSSITNDINISAEMQNPEIERQIIDVIDKSKKEIESLKKVKAKKVDEDAVVTPVAELVSFEDSFKKLNPEISLDELEVYTWYKTSVGKPLSRNYVALFDKSEANKEMHIMQETYEYHVSEDKISQWVAKGLLFYYKGKLVPQFEYVSGDMYDKKIQAESEKETIIERYGELVYENQIKELQSAFKNVYDRRLLIGGENTLVVLANSKFAEEFHVTRIEELPEDKKFKIKEVTAASQPDYGKPDILNDYKVSSDWKRKEFDEISLRDAFNYWMIKYRPELKEPVSHLDVVLYYVLLKPIRVAPKNDSVEASKEAAAKKEKLKSSTQREGERLFSYFLDTQLIASDKLRLETQWNMDYNNYLAPNLNKVPVAFTMAKEVMGKPEDVRPEKRDAVAFSINNGTAILSYDVGVGKTPSAIFAISAFMDAGYCSRPLIVVPNQVYRQFIGEIKMFTPHIAINEGYNLSKEYVDNFKNANGEIVPPSPGTITVMTYEGFENIGFKDETSDILMDGLYEILNQGGESEKSEKKIASFRERLETLLGKGLKGGMYNVEDFAFDFMCYDEAHKMKKVFTSVKGEAEETKDGGMTRGKNPYAITSGTPSSIGLKGFMVNFYILKNNNYKNILLLTATPFTNSPLEIFSMLAMVGYEQLQETNLNNIKTFFDTYVKASTELVINSKLKPQYKQVILGFNNLVSLQILIRRYILYKTGEEVGVVRPKKYVLPYLKEIDNGVTINLNEDKKVETYIEMTSQQKAMMADIINYVETGGGLGNSSMSSDEDIVLDEDEVIDITKGEDVDESFLSDKEKAGVRTIKGLSYSRNLALSPYLYEHSGLGKRPTYKEYIDSSPKLSYVMQCVQTVKDYCLSHKQPIAGQVIYMDRGIQYFPLIKEYLVKEFGYKEHEVGIIRSGLNKTGKNSKEYVKNLFNGEVYNEKVKEFEVVEDSQIIKVVIGSSTIKEGMNLQKYGAVLYNCFIDWNPTDIQQLEGRIYRQKNTFGAVRIVNPLVIDSADIFLFQKLQEKTARLNTIWATDGKTNVLHTEEFNPEELKYALIKNPSVIADLKIIEQKTKLDSKILGFNRQIDIAQRVKEVASTIMYRYKGLLESVTEYRDFEESGDKISDAAKLIQLANEIDKSQKDKDGKKMYYSWERGRLPWEERQNASLKEKYSKPYWISDIAVAVRDMKKYIHDFFQAYDIPFDINNYENNLNMFVQDVKHNIEEVDNEKKLLESKEYKDQVVAEVIEEKERQKISYKPLPAIVADFAKMNYLLNDKKVIANPEKLTYTTCPPLEADGKTLAIDEAAINMLEKHCLAHENQTKAAFFDEQKQEYTPERKAIHDKIIQEVFSKVKCIRKGTQPIAVFTGGSTASGKSTFLNKNAKYLLSDDVLHIDADDIRSKIPGYKGWNANATHLETQDIVNELLETIGSGGCQYDIVYDGTMNKAKKYFSLIEKVKKLGYKVYIVFMEIPYGEAKKRALSRYQRTGRYVPMEVIDDFFTKIGDKTRGQAALDELKDVVDGYIVVDGQESKVTSEGGEPIPLNRENSVYGRRFLSVDKSPKIKSETVDISENKLSKLDESKKRGKVYQQTEAQVYTDTETNKDSGMSEKEQQRKEVIETIEALQFLAEDNNQEAIDTIEALKFLLD